MLGAYRQREKKVSSKESEFECGQDGHVSQGPVREDEIRKKCLKIIEKVLSVAYDSD